MMIRRKDDPAASLAFVLTALSAVLAASCGDGGTTGPTVEPNRAPVATGTIPAQTVTVGQTATVDVAGYFSDPDGDALTYTAETSEAAVASVSVSGSTVIVSAVAQRSANVTVTATDPGGLSVRQGFAVTVPNRAPQAVDSIPAFQRTVGDTATVDLSVYFIDPDGDDLTYGVATSDTGVVAVSVMDSVVTAAAVARGTAALTVTATDPGGLSAMLSAQFTVADAAAGGFRDDFVPGSLSNWEIGEDTRAEISEGILRVTSLTEHGGYVLRFLDSPITDWEARISLARADRRASVAVSLGVGDEKDHIDYILVIGPPFVWEGETFNYFFFSEGRGADYIGTVGYSDAIGDGDGEFTEISIALKDGELTGHAGAVELFTLQIPDSLPTGLNGMAFGPDGAGIWSSPPGQTALFDWVEVRGGRGRGTASAGQTTTDERARGTLYTTRTPPGGTSTVNRGWSQAQDGQRSLVGHVSAKPGEVP